MGNAMFATALTISILPSDINGRAID